MHNIIFYFNNGEKVYETVEGETEKQLKKILDSNSDGFYVIEDEVRTRVLNLKNVNYVDVFKPSDVAASKINF